MRRWILVSLALHAVIGGALWWMALDREAEPPLSIRIDLGSQVLPARRANTVHSPSRAPVPELPPADQVPEPSPDSPGDERGSSGDSGGPVIDALTPGQSLEKPALLGYTLPDYPKEAKHRRWEGVVEALVTVDASGQPLEITVAHSSGHPELDDAAVSALRGARYKPGSADGTPVNATLTVTVRFRLQ